MVKRAILPVGLLASVAAAAFVPQWNAPEPVPGPAVANSGMAYPAPSPSAYDPVRQALAEWNRLRQSDGFGFTEYARFLTAHPGWPGDAVMRRTAERRLETQGAAPDEIVAYFGRYPPTTATGGARYADALLALGRPDEAIVAARAAWAAGVMPADVEGGLFSRFGAQFTATDHDRRMDALLWAHATASAVRTLGLTSPERRPLYGARLALQTGQGGAALPGYDRDAGYAVDRANWLRNSGQGAMARAYLAGPLAFDAPPSNPAMYLATLLTIARGAAADNQGSLVVGIADKADAAFAPGTDIRARPLSERDDYTSLVWLGGITALKKLGRPADAATLFARYARAAQTPGTQTKGLYWAARAMQAAGNPTAATAYLTEAAEHDDQFYGQLSSERIGRPLTLVTDPPPVAIGDGDRAAFEQDEVVRAARILGRDGRWTDQSLFLRTIATNARTQVQHQLAVALARDLGRPDLGVMVARNARLGTSDGVRFGFPTVPVPPAFSGQWTMIHAISRQESQFDRQASSRVGARGLMQLMPATAREQAGKLGLPYDYARLTSDPQYNIMLGSSFYQRMLSYYGGSHVLAVASYNAGPGNVNRFLRDNGDPRMPGVDVIDWIEAIPLTETRGYVQHVLENAVVYDMVNPQRSAAPQPNLLSSYLGKRSAG